MPDPDRLRESTEIVVPRDALQGIYEELEAEFTVTVFCRERRCRIIGSPVEIKAASEFLTRQGVTLP